MQSRSSAGHGGHGMPTGDARALKITGWLTGVYFFVELAIGYWSGSVAVVSDAFHTFSAVGGVLIALVAGRLARRPASPGATFGLIRAEIVGALLNGVFLLLMALYVLWMGYQRLQAPVEVPTGPMLWAAVGGLFTEVISLWLLFGRQKGNLNMRGALWHVVQTFVGSLIIIVAAVVIYFTDFYAIDPILGMAFGVVLFWASWGIIRDALSILLQAVPAGFDVPAMVAAVEGLAGVRDVHHVHVWALTSGKNIASLHARVEDGVDRDRLLEAIHHLLKGDFAVYFSTVQLESRCPEDGEAAAIDVPLRPLGERGDAHGGH